MEDLFGGMGGFSDFFSAIFGGMSMSGDPIRRTSRRPLRNRPRPISNSW